MLARFFSFVFGALLTLGLMAGSATVASAQAGYQIRPGDTLQIEVLEDSSLSRGVLVLPDGSINFPLAGTIQAGGRTVAQIQQSLATALVSNFAAAPNVFVSIGTLAGPRVSNSNTPAPTIDAYIMGEVAQPGKKEITPGTTILQFLAQAGGLTKFAADKRIELRRTDPESGAVTTHLFSYRGLGRGPHISGSTPLVPGDVVVVPQRRLFE